MELRNFFKKKEIKDIAQNEQDFYQKNPRKKSLKIFAASGLAFFMGIGTLCGVLIAPANPTTAAVSNESVVTNLQENGIIKPQNDDPLLFTTADGLEIKWGSAVTGGVETVTDQTAGTLNSGSLSGFPYFTTTDGTKTYTWVIIGRSSSGSYPTTAFQYSHTDLLKNWQTVSNNYNMMKYFFGSVYETTSPAGASIAAKLLDQYTTITKNVPIASTGFNISSLPAKDEIPSGCVLCLANDVTGSGVKNNRYYDHDDYNTSWYPSLYEDFSNYNYYKNSNLCDALDAIYTNQSLGLNMCMKSIVSVDLTTMGLDCYYIKAKGGMGLYSASRTKSHYIYTLSGSSTDTFYYATYLTAAQAKLSSNWWLRGQSTTSTTYFNSGYSQSGNCDYINTSGALAGQISTNSAGYRPAFCLKVV